MSLTTSYADAASEQAFVALLAEQGVLSVVWVIEHTACTDWVEPGSVEAEMASGSNEVVLDDGLDRWLYHLADHLIPDGTSGRLLLDVPTRTVTWTTMFMPNWAEGGWFDVDLAQCPTYRISWA